MAHMRLRARVNQDRLIHCLYLNEDLIKISMLCYNSEYKHNQTSLQTATLVIAALLSDASLKRPRFLSDYPAA